MELKNEDFLVEELGKRSIDSPLEMSVTSGDGKANYIQDDERVLYETSLRSFHHFHRLEKDPISFEKAGPREKIYFDPTKTRVGIVTCGGLCPGLNNVIRSLVKQLYRRYGVQNVIGFKYGYEGLIPSHKHKIVEFKTDEVDEIPLSGGTLLGSSRGHQSVEEMVNTIERMNLSILFTIGGDGTLSGAHEIAKEVKKRGLKLSIACIPKTIDNDINFIKKSFGFETAFTVANIVIRDAHNEAKGAYNGIALVKLMGRDSGFIAANAALATQDVNFVLIPEIEFDLKGENGFIAALKKHLEYRKHCVVVVAEGAGQHLFKDEPKQLDKSGNEKYKDIGLYLKEVIKEEFNKMDFPHTVKYIDPSYIIRSTAANANDSVFCNLLAQNAVHAAMAGKTDFVVGYWAGQCTVLPIQAIVKSGRKRIDLESDLWSDVLQSTGQPDVLNNKKKKV